MRFTILFLLILGFVKGEIDLGEFKQTSHAVVGRVSILNSKTIKIYGFSYDGLGPGGVFSGVPGSRQNIASELFLIHDENCLNGAQGAKISSYSSKTLTLTLPKGKTIHDMNYFDVWCAVAGVSFGHVEINSTTKSEVADIVGDFSCSDRPLKLEVDLGLFANTIYGVQGRVTVLDSKTIKIYSFSYSGNGPAGLFWGGLATSRSDIRSQYFVIPDESCNNADTNGRLPAYSAKNITLILPTSKSVLDMNYFDVWCEAAGVSFGHVIIRAEHKSVLSIVSKDTDCISERNKDKEISVGYLQQTIHGVSGFVKIVNSKVIKIENFTYDGLGPAGLFWAVTGTRGQITSNYFVIADENCQNGKVGNRLPAYTSKTITLRLPNGRSLNSVNYFDVWCEEAAVSFGHVEITSAHKLAMINADDSAACPPLDGGGGGSENCEILSPTLHLRWRMSGTRIIFTVQGIVKESDYIAFGISGRTQSHFMEGADFAVLFYDNDKANAFDYYVAEGRENRAQCSNGRGVCPDALQGGKDSLTVISGQRAKCLTTVQYSRELSTGDSIYDKSIDPNAETQIVFAMGPRQEDTNFAIFHTTWITSPKSIVFGRAGKDNCAAAPIESECVGVTDSRFKTQSIENEKVIKAVIGPSGGDRGYLAITGKTGWGIAFYLNDKLSPIVAVERGEKYRFECEGGKDASAPARYHPFYITDSPIGGYDQKNQVEKQNETVYIGVTSTGEYSGSGKFCEYIETDATAKLKEPTYEEYFETLDKTTECPASSREPAILEWTPDNTVPFLVYYQCVTHKNLGYQIRVYDKDVLGNESDLKKCRLSIEGKYRTFEKCAEIGNKNNIFDIFWNEDKVGNTITFAARALTNGGWMGFGFSDPSRDPNFPMIGSNVVIGWSSGPNVFVGDYQLNGKTQSGVTVKGNQKLKDLFIESDHKGFTTIMFTRNKTLETAPAIIEVTNIVFALGNEPKYGGQIVPQHYWRGFGSLDIEKGEFQRKTNPIALAHGSLMGIAWAVLIPSGIISARFFKKSTIWFQLHQAFQYSALILSLVGFILGYGFIGSRTQIAHIVIGTIILFMAVLQFINPFFRPDKEAPKRKYWNWLHWYNARILFLLTTSNIFIGLYAFSASNVAFILVAIWFLIVFLTFISLQVVRNREMAKGKN